MVYQQDHAAENGAALRGPQLFGDHDRVQVRGNVEKTGGQQQRHRALDTVGLAQMQGAAAARTVV